MRPHIYLKKRSETAYSGFLVSDPKAINKVNANPFTESAGVGGPYTELQGWQEWAQEDWMAGINRKKTDDLGALYSSALTNVPGQLTLPPALLRSPITYPEYDQTTIRHYPYSMTNSLTLCRPSSNIQRIATFLPNWGGSDSNIRVYAYMKYGGVLDVTIYAGGAATPIAGTQLSTLSVDLRRVTDGSNVPPEGDPYWHLLYTGNPTIPAEGIWAVITLTDGVRDLYIPNQYDGPVTNAQTQKYQTQTGAWVNCVAPNAGAYRFPIIVFAQDALNAVAVTSMTIIGTKVVTTTNNSANITTYDLAGAVSGTSMTYTPTSIAQFDGNVYVARGSSYDIIKITGLTIGAGAAVTGVKATLLLEANGYLWRANGDLLYYSGDGSTWTEIVTPGRTILAMGSMEGELYYATTEGLYYVAPGDFVQQVTKWAVGVTAGKYTIITHQGSLWIATPDDLYRLDSGRSFVHDNPFQNTEAYQYKQQVPIALATTQTRLFALFQTNKAQPRNPSLNLMEWTPEGWHQIKRIGSRRDATNEGCMLYEPTTSSLLIATGQDNYKLNLSAAYSNPYINDEQFTFEGYAWLEYPRFYGNRYLINKHFDQINLLSEALGNTNGHKVDVYYRTELYPNYTLLGTIQSQDTALRWTGADLAGKWVQLAFLITSTNKLTTPRIKATILKYQSLVADRARWSIPIEIDASQDVDGWHYSSAGIVADTVERLDELIATEEPLVYKDVRGVAYEVSLQSYSEQLTKYEYKSHTDEAVTCHIYTLIIEQIVPGTYTA
jgi:hypothetical protein